MPPKQRRVAVMGFRSVGKSSLTIQFVQNQFVDSYDPTIENTFQKVVKFRGQDFQLELIDTAGQDEHSVVSHSYLMNMDGYVLVYSVTSKRSFDIVKVIHDKILDMTGKAHLPLILVGNKTDLHLEREVTTEEGKRTAEEWRAAFLETSAKENQKVQDIFTTLIFEVEKADGNIKDNGGCIVQ